MKQFTTALLLVCFVNVSLAQVDGDELRQKRITTADNEVLSACDFGVPSCPRTGGLRAQQRSFRFL